MNKYVSFRLWNMHAVLLFCCVVFGVYYRLCLFVGLIHAYTYRDQSVYAPSPWKTTLHCNVVSHCLGAYTKRSLYPAFFRWHWGNRVTTIKQQQKQQSAKVVHNSHRQKALNLKTQMFLVSSCSCLYPNHWRQVLSREWRFSWGTDRRCSNYIWVISNFNCLLKCAYIRGFTV